jgi:hypothetical protein
MSLDSWYNSENTLKNGQVLILILLCISMAFSAGITCQKFKAGQYPTVNYNQDGYRYRSSLNIELRQQPFPAEITDIGIKYWITLPEMYDNQTDTFYIYYDSFENNTKTWNKIN